MHAPQLTTAFYKSVINSQFPLPPDDESAAVFWPEAKLGQSALLPTERGASGQATDLPGWVRVLSKLSGWDWATQS
ncbi:MAG TPA: hypothetical protein VIW64_01970 [Pyrinomonadaceae bacterium]|jgi:hypothetical protein